MSAAIKAARRQQQVERRAAQPPPNEITDEASHVPITGEGGRLVNLRWRRR
ncbi:MAG: hypothetical protein KGJ66_08455 [Alphaproteobacteria bacterium]|nr:hypothetical protein [Alphaproteobacteria bacterium]